MAIDLSSLYAELTAKIQAASAGATAEDLAYLATAAERIGGKASVLDVLQHAAEAKLEMTTVKDQLISLINAGTEAYVQTIEQASDLVMGTISVAAAQAQTDKTAALSAIDFARTQALSDIAAAYGGGAAQANGINMITYFMGQLN